MLKLRFEKFVPSQGKKKNSQTLLLPVKTKDLGPYKTFPEKACLNLL